MVAFWLMPAVHEAALLDSLVRRLVEEHSAPVFEPHLTLFAGKIAAQPALHALRTVRVRPLYELRVERIGYSDEFTKTFFIQFCHSAELQQLSDALSSSVSASGSYELNPHLSLLYKKLPRRTKAKLASVISVPFRQVNFDRLQVVAGNDHTAQGEDVASWKTLAVRRLNDTL
ncbi:MAG: hypothetical protein H0U43_08685 [Chthoniobacterales bacterium]|nr:hypothetical protein [Chthoniobacterales bacterium]